MNSKKLVRRAVFIAAIAVFAAGLPAAAAEAGADNFKAKKTICSICGAKIDIAPDTPFSDYMGVRYYFASPAYKAQFDKNAFKYAADILTCPVCGTQENRKARTFLETKESGKSYFVCCPGHLKEFNREPLKYTEGKNSINSTMQFKKPQDNEYDNTEILKKRVPDTVLALEEVKYDYKIFVNIKNKVRKPTPGSIFVKLYAKIKNASKTELRMLMGRWEMTDTDGNSHITVYNSIEGTLPYILQPGGKIDAVLVYELPFGGVPKTLILKSSMLSCEPFEIPPLKKQ